MKTSTGTNTGSRADSGVKQVCCSYNSARGYFDNIIDYMEAIVREYVGAHGRELQFDLHVLRCSPMLCITGRIGTFSLSLASLLLVATQSVAMH